MSCGDIIKSAALGTLLARFAGPISSALGAGAMLGITYSAKVLEVASKCFNVLIGPKWDSIEEEVAERSLTPVYIDQEQQFARDGLTPTNEFDYDSD